MSIQAASIYNLHLSPQQSLAELRTEIGKYEKLKKIATVVNKIGCSMLAGGLIASALFFGSPLFAVMLPVAIAFFILILLTIAAVGSRTSTKPGTENELLKLGLDGLRYSARLWTPIASFVYKPAVATIVGIAGGSITLIGGGLYLTTSLLNRYYDHKINLLQIENRRINPS